MSLLVFIIVAIIVVALIMWAIYYVPMPPGSPIWIKNLLYILVLLIAVFAIVYQTGLIHA
jgi:hypothetical protein